MSATTILESYDTQMLEDFPSGDYDVAMQTAGSSSDIWFQGESVMDQDGHHDSVTLDATDRGSVEVEMDETYPDADHESVEYEMADEAEYQPESIDLLDVEVYDASQLHSPATIPAIPTSHSTSNDDIAVGSTSVFSESHNPASTHEEHEDIHLSSDFEVPAAEIAPAAAQPSEVQDEAVNPGVIPTVNHSEPSVDLTTVEGLETADETLTYGSDILNSHPVNEAVEPPVSVSDVVHHAAHLEVNTDNDHEDGAEAPVLVSNPQEHEVEALTEEPQQPAVPVEDAEPHISEHEHQPELAGDETAVDNDPHEISEGIYIDPPPPVLLSLQLSESEHGEVSLFNQPSSRVGSQGPEEDHEPSGQEAVPLLLHHRPTLYYEPLVNVFEALRQEEYITQLFELAEGELVLDAYDLQLVISEDNTHAREVTLHDLNVIHDGSDLQGPLRIHLHVSIPRFIFRYHTLRDQIARLNLAAEVGEEEQPLATYDQEHEQLTEEYHEEQAQPEDIAQSFEDQQHEENPEEEQAVEYTEEPHIGSDPAPPELPEDPATGDNSEPVHGDLGDTGTDEETGQTAEINPEDASAHADNTAPPLEEETPVQHDEAPDDDGNAHPDHLDVTEHEQPTEPAEYSEQHIEELPQDEGVQDLTEEDELTLEYPEVDDAEFAESGDAEPSPQQSGDQDTHDILDATDVAGSLAAPVDDESHDTGEEISEKFDKTDAAEDTFDDLDHTSAETVSKHEDVAGVDESDANFVAMLQNEADNNDAAAEASTSGLHDGEQQELEYPELEDDDWDGELEADGEIDPTWPAGDHDDGLSNQSTVTLASSTSNSKRPRDDDEAGEGEDVSDYLQNGSPGSKRPRVA